MLLVETRCTSVQRKCQIYSVHQPCANTYIPLASLTSVPLEYFSSLVHAASSLSPISSVAPSSMDTLSDGKIF